MPEAWWDDFSGGEYGDVGGWDAPKGTFAGLNMKVDRDGSVCPRKGAVSLALTGLTPTTDPFAAEAQVETFSSTPKVFVLFGGGPAYGASFNSEATVGSGWENYTNTATYYVQTYTPHLMYSPGFTYFGEAPDADNAARHRLIEVDHHALTLTSIAATGTWKNYRAALYLDRIYRERDHQDYLAAVDYSNGPNPDTLAYGFATFPGTAPAADGSASGGMFLVGSKSRIQQFVPWRDSLLFFKDSEVWQLRGVPSSSAILRRLCALDVLGAAGGGLFIPHAQQIQVLSDNSIMIAPNKGFRPVVFDGAQGREVSHVNLGRQGRHLVAPRRDGSAGAVIFDSLLPNGAGTGYDWHWTGKHWLKWLLPRPTMASRPSGVLSIWPRQGVVQRAYGTDHLFLVEQVSGGGYNEYRLPLATDGPGLSNSPVELPGDGSTTALDASLTLPVLRAPDRQIKVRKVIVECEKWRTGGASTNNITLTVAHFTRWRAAQANSSARSWSEANASSGASTGDHTSQRIELVPDGLIWSGAVELRFTAVRGLSIRSVKVEYETSGAP